MTPKIIEARELKRGNQILTPYGRIDTIIECGPGQHYEKPIILIRLKDGRHLYFEDSLIYEPDELVTRIDPDDPEPVEVREYWNLGMRAVDRVAGRRVHSRESLDHILKNRGASTVTIEHIRETVLSRETVLPEPPT
jgi:hypothetical protein